MRTETREKIAWCLKEWRVWVELLEDNYFSMKTLRGSGLR